MTATPEDEGESGEAWFGAVDRGPCRHSYEELDGITREDTGVDDPVRWQSILDRDQAQCEATWAWEAACSSADEAPPIMPEEFAAELIDAGPDGAAAMLGSMDPGPETAAMLAMLRPSVLTPAAMVSVVAATEKLLSWVQARQHRWIAAFACPDVVAPRADLQRYASQPGQPLHPKRTVRSENGNDEVGASEKDLAEHLSGSAVYGDPNVDAVLTEVALNVAAAEIGAALHFTPVTSKRRVCQAVDYAIDLPATLTALEAGRIDRGRAGVIAERTQNLPVDLRRKVECSVLPKATSRTTGQVRGIVDRAVISVDPEAAKKRHQRAIAQRNISYRAGEDGIGVFRAELAADRAQVAYSVIDQIADQLRRVPAEGGEIDDRGIGALRADVFSDLFDQLACSGTITLHDTFIRRATGSSATPAPANEPGNGTAGTRSRSSTDSDSTACGGFAEPEDGTQCDSVDHEGTSQVGRIANRRTDGGGLEVADGMAGAGGVEVADGMADAEVADGMADAGGAEVANGIVGAGGAEVADGMADAGCADVADEIVGAGGVENDSDDSNSFALTTNAKAAMTVPTPNTHDLVSSAGRNSDAYRHLGTHHGRHTHLNVTIAQSTLAGLDDRPGELEGHGPIPADLARAIALSAETITAIAIKPGCGTGLDLGRTSYRPRLAQRDYVTTRDQTCRFPGCRRAAKRCQIDHSDEYCPGRKDGGVTCPCNLSCLCAFHHGLKTGGLWDSVQHSDGTITWKSPTGRKYTTYPRQWPTDHGDEPILNSPSPLASLSSASASSGGGTAIEDFTSANSGNDSAASPSTPNGIPSGDSGVAKKELDDEPPF